MDIRNLRLLKKTFKKYQPDYVFHLAAQSLVKRSYSDPIYTWETNTVGTLNVLESLRELRKNCIAVLITSDKSYKNLEIKRGYSENDILGGKDPYSASKASAELAIQSYISSFFPSKKTKVLIGIARAGNVIGGGDWSENRLIPDCIKSLLKNKVIFLRQPNFNRPWQHVLEPLKGYLILAKKQFLSPKKYSDAWNFGTKNNSVKSVKEIVNYMIAFWGSGKIKVNTKNKFYEQKNLQLDINKAKNRLKWLPTYSVKEGVKITTEWYLQVFKNKKDPYKVTNKQIKDYMNENNWS